MPGLDGAETVPEVTLVWLTSDPEVTPVSTSRRRPRSSLRMSIAEW